jgi:predicted GIY-YIG superfamily endonuclease
MIIYSPQVKAFLLSFDYHLSIRTSNLHYVYLLKHEGKPFYCGSTANPLARYTDHARHVCKDSAKYLKSHNEPDFVMEIIDVTSEKDCLTIEAIHQQSNTGLVNSSNYAVKAMGWHCNPDNFLCINSKREKWEQYIVDQKQEKTN